MENSYFRELSRRLRLEGVESDQREDQLDILLRGEPVFYVSPASDVFLLPAGSNDLEVSELYHQVAVMADEVYGYVEAMKHTPLLRASGLHEEFHLLADFGGAVLAGQERENGQGYQFVTWIWDYPAFLNQHPQVRSPSPWPVSPLCVPGKRRLSVTSREPK